MSSLSTSTFSKIDLSLDRKSIITDQELSSVTSARTSNQCLTKHTPAEWDAIYEEFSGLYKSGLYTLAQIRRYFHGLGFDASERQYKRKIEAWKLSGKNIKTSDKEFMVRKEVQRLELGKKTAFWVNGRQVEERKLLEARKKILSESFIVKSLGHTPNHITYETPKSLVADLNAVIQRDKLRSFGDNDWTVPLDSPSDQHIMALSSHRDRLGLGKTRAHPSASYWCGCGWCFSNHSFGNPLDDLKQHIKQWHVDWRILSTARSSSGATVRDNLSDLELDLYQSEQWSGLQIQQEFWFPGSPGIPEILHDSTDVISAPAWDGIIYGCKALFYDRIEMLGASLDLNLDLSLVGAVERDLQPDPSHDELEEWPLGMTDAQTTLSYIRWVDSTFSHLLKGQGKPSVPEQSIATNLSDQAMSDQDSPDNNESTILSSYGYATTILAQQQSFQDTALRLDKASSHRSAEQPLDFGTGWEDMQYLTSDVDWLSPFLKDDTEQNRTWHWDGEARSADRLERGGTISSHHKPF